MRISTYHPFQKPCIVDQKDLNELVVMAIAKVAKCNPLHCAQLFGLTVPMAERFAWLASLTVEGVDPLLDLATTPAPLWRVTMSAQEVVAMQRQEMPMAEFYLEPYRDIIAKLNEQVILLLLRYTAQPHTAALVSGLGDVAFMRAMADASCATLLHSVRNLGRPLVTLTINELYIDRIFSTKSGEALNADARGLMARVMCDWTDYAQLIAAMEQEAEQSAQVQAPRTPQKLGRPTAVFLPPGEAEIIESLVHHGVSAKMILAFTGSKVNVVQLRRLREQASVNSVQLWPHDTNAGLWGHAQRRLIATAMFAHYRVLMSLGVASTLAFVQAYEYYELHYKDPVHHLSLARLIASVYMPMREGLVHLSHCETCSSMHLVHDSHHNQVACPLCSMAKTRRLAHLAAKKTTLKPTTKLRAKKGRVLIDQGASSAPIRVDLHGLAAWPNLVRADTHSSEVGLGSKPARHDRDPAFAFLAAAVKPGAAFVDRVR